MKWFLFLKSRYQSFVGVGEEAENLFVSLPNQLQGKKYGFGGSEVIFILKLSLNFT